MPPGEYAGTGGGAELSGIPVDGSLSEPSVALGEGWPPVMCSIIVGVPSSRPVLVSQGLGLGTELINAMIYYRVRRMCLFDVWECI